MKEKIEGEEEGEKDNVKEKIEDVGRMSILTSLPLP